VGPGVDVGRRALGHDEPRVGRSAQLQDVHAPGVALHQLIDRGRKIVGGAVALLEVGGDQSIDGGGACGRGDLGRGGQAAGVGGLGEQLERDTLIERGAAQLIGTGYVGRGGLRGDHLRLRRDARPPHGVAVDHGDLEIVGGRARRGDRGQGRGRGRRRSRRPTTGRDREAEHEDDPEAAHGGQSRCTSASRAISLPTEMTATPITMTSTAAT